MSRRFSRRGALALMACASLAGCGGTKLYKDAGPKNLEMVLTGSDGGAFITRDVYLDVWTGPKGPGMQYLGTTKFVPGRTSIGLPVGRPLHLALAFEEKVRFSAAGQTDTIEIPMSSLGSADRWRVTVSFDRNGFDHEARRIR